MRASHAVPLPQLLAGVLGILLLWDVTHFLRVMLRSSAVTSALHTRAAALPRRGAERMRILAAHLFGREPIGSAAPRLTAAGHLKLSGTIALSDPARGVAIISGPDGRSQLYRAGAQLPGGDRLRWIYRDHVALQAVDGEEILPLQKVHNSGNPSNSQSGEQLVDADTDRDTSKDQDPFAPPPLPTSGAVMRSLNLRPMDRNGASVIRIGGGAASAAALAKIGLSPGDVVLNVDGEPAETQSAGAIMHALSAGQTTTLTVEHGGSVMDVAIDSEQADAMAEAYRGSGQPQ